MSRLTLAQSIELHVIYSDLAHTREEIRTMLTLAAVDGHIDPAHLRERLEEMSISTEMLMQFKLTNKPNITMKGQPTMRTTTSIIVHAKRIPATDRSGSKIRAISDGKQITIPYPHQSNDPHELAVRRLYPDALTVTEVQTDNAQRGLKFVVEVAA